MRASDAEGGWGILNRSLSDALRQLRQVHSVNSNSTAALARQVRAKSGRARMVRISALHGWRAVKPSDLLIGLAQTFPLGSLTDPYRLFDRWAQLKYVAAFESGLKQKGHLSLKLSDETKRVAHNQRRVFSEELGLAFAIEAAKAWHTSVSGPNAIISIVDVDDLVGLGTIDVFGKQHSLVHLAGKRADYVIMSRNPSSPNTAYLSVLESKGTVSATNSIEQLAKAQEQLGQLRIGDVTPPGMAAGTVLNSDELTVNVLRTASPHGVGGSESGLHLSVAIDPSATDSSRSPLERDATAALRLSFAIQATNSGNAPAARLWGVDVDDRFDRSERAQVLFDGRSYLGTSARIPTPTGTAEVFIGSDLEVDEALTRGELDEVSRAQSVVARRRISRLTSSPDTDGDDDEAVAVSSDGLILRVRSIAAD